MRFQLIQYIEDPRAVWRVLTGQTREMKIQFAEKIELNSIGPIEYIQRTECCAPYGPL